MIANQQINKMHTMSTVLYFLKVCMYGCYTDSSFSSKVLSVNHIEYVNP